MTKKYSITVVTVVKNSDKTIEKCIESVLSQNYQKLEYILIDGKSNDQTLKKINKYKDKISLIVSENDEGIWNAMNKGLNLANGEIITFLNADDFYYNNTLNTVNDYFNKFNIDFLFGSVKKYKILNGFKPWKIKFSFGFYTSHSIGFFIKTEQHRKVGLYNTQFLSSDLDFFYRMIVNFKLNGKSTKKNEIFGEFGKGGFSSKINYIDHLRDLNKIRINNNQNFIFVYLIFLYKIIKKPIRFLRALLNY